MLFTTFPDGTDTVVVKLLTLAWIRVVPNSMSIIAIIAMSIIATDSQYKKLPLAH